MTDMYKERAKFKTAFPPEEELDAQPLSRSVQRRVAAQKGEPAPDFSQDDKKLREKIAEEALKAFCPNEEYKQLDGSALIILNMKCYRVADKALALLQPKIEEARRQVGKDLEKIIRSSILTDDGWVYTIPASFVEALKGGE